MLIRKRIAIVIFLVLAVIGTAPSLVPAQQGPPMATWVMGFPISFESCKARVSAAYSAEGFGGLLDFGNGWLAWNRGAGAAIACIHGNNETVVSIVTAGTDAALMRDRLAADIRAGGEMGMFIMNTLSGKCIDVDGAPGTGNGARLQLWDCEYAGGPNNSPTDQKWSLTGDGFIRNALSGKCIDVDGAPGTANGARLQLWDCEFAGGANNSPTDQRWTLTGEGLIRNMLSGKCIDVNGAPGTANGASLQLWDCEYFSGPNNSPTDQRWSFRR